MLELRSRIADIVARPASPLRSLPAVPLDDTLDPTADPTAASIGTSHPGGSSVRVSSPRWSGKAAIRSVCSFSSPAIPKNTSPLGFGIEAIDARLPAGGLQSHGLHELKPGTPRDTAAALALALALARRPAASGRPLLMVLAGRAASEHGLPYGPGLARLGLDPGQLILITAKRAADALWAIEEGLRAKALGAVIASLDTVAMLPARRLVLAAAEGATPCLMLTSPSKAGISVAHTRWRIASLAGARHPFAPAAPGAWRCALTLERCRQGPSDLTWTLEWCDASHSFNLAAAVSPGALAAAGAGRRAG
jgi:protein ImuA